ncbi:MAG: ATP-binding cassette domain-containing protein [Gammaproteobacteria bacterium]|nr:ATP-binding cassette domain-containing protein [Gammaproteobacteria bacterium]
MNQLDLNFAFQYPRQDFKLAAQLKVEWSGCLGVVGASGSGKSTLLNILAGFLCPHSGAVSFNGSHWTQSAAHRVQCSDREVAYIRQSENLLPHLSVLQNIEYARKRASDPLAVEEQTILLEKFACKALLNKLPAQLSGGEQQRVALLRSLIIKPQLILLDEPMSALDTTSRSRLLSIIKQYQDKFNVPMLWISHTLPELAVLTQHALVVEDGRVNYCADLHQRMLEPNQGLEVGESLAQIIPITQTKYDQQDMLWVAQSPLGVLFLPQEFRSDGVRPQPPTLVRISARDVSLSLTEEKQSSVLNQFMMEIRSIKQSSEQPRVGVVLQKNDHTIYAEITRRSLVQLKLYEGQMVWVRVKSLGLLSG